MACGRVGTHVANLMLRPTAPGTVAVTCANNPEFRLIVQNLNGSPTADGFAADLYSDTAGGTFVVQRRATGYRIDHSTCPWFWLEFETE